MKVLLELIRIVFIFLLLGLILSTLLRNLYLSIGVNLDKFGWMGPVAIFSLLFVLYRNKLQFSGWYTGKTRVKLSKKVTTFLVSVSVLLIISLPILSYLFN
ncbi:hypothetical protein CN514_14865 [Bacillus sp. AFS001701]|uniref:hypothetical protein n=1 Tax=Bacillus sp. AFS001701 TaxID=2033480 RepID=UPI000BF29C9D|nr:hypothetical protein [Bacillus sp. AFS001701]PET58412.1 hypothetical protein CN514_14865 [Bacillus sp. AFS001701]